MGLSFVNHASNLLAKEVVVVGSPARLELARGLGATDAYDYHTENLAEQISVEHSEGFDFIIDAVGKLGQVDRVLPLLNVGGSVGIYGVDDYFRLTLAPHLARGTFTFFNGGYAEEESSEAVIRLVREGRLVAKHNFYDPSRIFDLEDINAAFAAVRNREMVKAVVKTSG